MIGYMKRHERYVKEMLEKNLSIEALKDLIEHHDKQIRWMQHERLVHLITMLFVCLFTSLAFGFTIVKPTFPFFVLLALLIILSIAYIIHYYRLEKKKKKWYDLSNQLKLNQR